MLPARLYHKVQTGNKRADGLMLQQPQAHLLVLQCEQTSFHVQAAGKTVQAAVGTNHPMARYNQRNRVVAQRCPRGLSGARPATHLASNPAIGARFAIADATSGGPDRQLEG